MVPLESVGVVHDKLSSSQEGSSMWSSSSDGDILSQRTPPPGPVIVQFLSVGCMFVQGRAVTQTQHTASL